MARKKKEEPKPPRFSKEEIQVGLDVLHQEYFMQVIGLLSHDPAIPELNYVKVPLETPDGGLYLVSILHIEGPKINLLKLAAAAEQTEKEQDEKAKEEKKDVL